MTEQEYTVLKMEIEDRKLLRLSSSWTKAYAIFTVILVFFPLLFMLPLIGDGKPLTMGQILGLLMIMGLMYLAFYQLVHASTVDLEGDKVHIKKMFGQVFTIQLNQLDKVFSFKFSRTIYSVIKFTDDNGIKQTALMQNAHSLWLGYEIAGAEVIKLAQSIYKS